MRAPGDGELQGPSAAAAVFPQSPLGCRWLRPRIALDRLTNQQSEWTHLSLPLATGRVRAECLWLTHGRAEAVRAFGVGAASALTTGSRSQCLWLV